MASGRQKEFDKAEALASAMQVFWRKGYLGASLSDLCEAMGINKPSMYATYGNKEALFVAATDHYIEAYASPHLRLLDEQQCSSSTDLRSRLRSYLISVLSEQCAQSSLPSGAHSGEKSSPLGCYISLCVSESASDSLPPEANEKVLHARDYAEIRLKEFFSQEIEKGRLSKTQDADVVAKTVITLLHGTASMARGGASLASLTPVVDTILDAFAFT